MSGKSRPFSIYLLRQGYHAQNALVADHGLSVSNGDRLPDGSQFYVLNTARKRPWWHSYFGIAEDLWQEFKGGLLFLPVGGRCFAISFGQVYHSLQDASYECDFGLRVTLNMLDPKELRSADTMEPGPARRQRTQVPVSASLDALKYDANSEIIKSLTGRVKSGFAGLLKSATGSASLKISLKGEPDELLERCERFLEIYNSEDHKISFPNIGNIVPIRNPDDIAPLDARLIESLKARSEAVTLCIPDIVDYKDNTCCVFDGGEGVSRIYPEISVAQFCEYVGEVALEHLTLEELKHRYRLVLSDADGVRGKSYSLYRTLIFNIEGAEGEAFCHLCEGAWYRVSDELAKQVQTYLDAKCEPVDLEPYNHDEMIGGIPAYSERRYNAAVAAANSDFLCLDREDISPNGSTTIEPCDIYTVRADSGASSGFRATFYHIKISTRSGQLSHLFNQGLNSVKIISREKKSHEKIKAVIIDRLAGADPAAFLAPFDGNDFKVVFGIITRKDPSAKSANLPLFSKLSLMRNMQWLDFAKIPTSLMFIPDQSAVKGGYAPYRTCIVEIVLDGRKRVRAVDGQGLDSAINIRGCAKDVLEREVGARFSISVKIKDGNYISSHRWPYSEII